MKPKDRGSQQPGAKIIINMEAPEECRVALVENNRLEAFDVETLFHVQTRGNLYKAKLVNVEPSLQAAFVDIGFPRNAYLPLDEIHPEYYGYAEDKKRMPELLKRGQELMVQIVKEETQLKGAAVTTYLSIPGRYLVLMPGTEHIGVSRKIENEQERQRLKQMLKGFKVPEGVGLIVRTASEGVPKREIQKDLRYLLRLWRALRKKVRSVKAPSLIYQDRDLVTRFLRDYLTSEVKEIVADDPGVYESIRSFLKVIAPRQVATVRLYQGADPIFIKFGVEEQIDQIYQPRVELPSGGHIMIEPTEALVSIDVNSGKYIKEKDLEETALKTNLEAAEAIARQLRLRDLGGIIVIDFIDMRVRSHRQQLEKKMRECLKKDKARTEISRISRFGLLELVRQKIKSPVQLGSYHTCPACNGRGIIRSVETLALAHLRRIKAWLASKDTEGIKGISLAVPSDVAAYLLNRKRKILCSLEDRYKITIDIEADSALGLEEHRISPIKE